MEEGPRKTQGHQHHGSRGQKRRGQSPAPTGETITKKKGVPVGMIVMAVAGSLFVCYLTNAGNVQTDIDGFFGAQVHSAHSY